MGRVYEEIDERQRAWIARQPLFFVASAPLDGDGHVNVSPKGPIDTLRVLGPREVAYLDFMGSGAETLAHVRENGRIVVMLCAFAGPPRVLRLHGRAEAIVRGEPGFDELLARAAFEDLGPAQSRRAIVRVDVTRIADSCGYCVPLMEPAGERPRYPASAAKQLRRLGADGMWSDELERHAQSIDGLPGLPAPDAA